MLFFYKMRTLTAITISLMLNPFGGWAQDYSLEEKVNSFIRKAVPLVGTDEVRDWKHATVLDARKPHEYEVSHLPNAIYIGECPHHLEPIDHLSQSDTIIVYCTVGYRSENLGEQLREFGYTNVFNLFGGIFEWKNSGGAVVDHNGSSTEKVHSHTENWAVFLKSGEAVY